MEIFSFEQLENARDLNIDDKLQSMVQTLAVESFSDDEDVTFTITKAMSLNDQYYIQICPNKNIGTESIIFVIANSEVKKCYSLEGNVYSLWFS